MTTRRRVITRTRRTQDSGTKAPNDVRKICAGLGMEPVDVGINGGPLRKAYQAVGASGRLAAALLATRDRDVVLAQYPLGFPADRLVALLPERGRRVALVHDIETLRRGTAVDRDVRRLGRYDVVIAPTPAMATWLRERLPAGPEIHTLGMFDYLLGEAVELPTAQDRATQLYFVGNLRPDKAAFLYTLGPTAVPVAAYGPNCDTDLLPSGVAWRGVLAADRPVLPAIDGFGLLWDGNSPDRLAGTMGRYLTYNAPHKLSFYVAAGLPVVVPERSAVADLVVGTGVGLTASSVYQAAERVRDCSADAWLGYCAAVAKLREKVVAGGFTTDAVRSSTAARGHGVSPVGGAGQGPVSAS